jgi:predicted nucleic acid binding AN1-type Zn finger protein
MNEERAGMPDAVSPIQVCEICGPDKRPEQVFQCMVCLKYFCVAHYGVWAHDCFTHEG